MVTKSLEELSSLVTSDFLKAAGNVHFEEERDVNINWFIPFNPIEDRIYSEMFLISWLEYGSYLDHFSMGWSTRLEVILQSSLCPVDEYHGRVAAAIFAWLGTNVGLSHVRIYAEKARSYKKPFFNSRNNIGLDLWNEVLCVDQHGGFVLGYRLAKLIDKKSLSTLTYHEMSLAQNILLYIFNEEGFKFLEQVLQKIERHQNKLIKARKF